MFLILHHLPEFIALVWALAFLCQWIDKQLVRNARIRRRLGI
jgi:hypothetical protein